MNASFALHGWRALIVFAIVGSCAIASAVTPEVSVRLRALKGAVTVAGSRLSIRAVSSETRPVIQTRDFDRLSFQYQRSDGRERWIVSDPATGKKLATVQDSRVEIVGQEIRVDLRPAPSHIRLIGSGSKMNLVGFLSVEEYLEGVVASEVPGDWPMEALKAQAIAARSFTMARIRERQDLGGDWILESNVTDQVFDFSRVHSRASDAVRATAGEVLMDRDDQVVAANYHADCGGQTDEPKSIWGGGLKTGTAVDRGCSTSGRSPWRFVSTLDVLAAKLSARQLVPTGFKLASLSILKRTTGGRALLVKAQAADGRTEEFSGEQLREALGYSELKSTLFQVSVGTALSRHQVEFMGRGFGHGTGLCQWGSRQLAASGKTYREILAHYYPRLELRPRTQIAQAK